MFRRHKRTNVQCNMGLKWVVCNCVVNLYGTLHCQLLGLRQFVCNLFRNYIWWFANLFGSCNRNTSHNGLESFDCWAL